nr:DnaJ homolog subfamily C GRV2 isoform X1 [Tanacetum cinerariifolium]
VWAAYKDQKHDLFLPSNTQISSAGIARLIENSSSSRLTYSLTAPPQHPNSAKPPAAITSDESSWRRGRRLRRARSVYVNTKVRMNLMTRRKGSSGNSVMRVILGTGYGTSQVRPKVGRGPSKTMNPSLSKEVCVGQYYLRLLLESGTNARAKKFPLRDFFRALYHWFLCDANTRLTVDGVVPDEMGAYNDWCDMGRLDGFGVVEAFRSESFVLEQWQLYHNIIGPFEGTSHITVLLDRTDDRALRHRLLLLLKVRGIYVRLFLKDPNPKRFLEGLLDQYLSSIAATHHNTQGSDPELPLLLSAALVSLLRVHPALADHVGYLGYVPKLLSTVAFEARRETMFSEELPMPDAPLEGEDNPSQASQTLQEKVRLSCLRVVHQLAASRTCAEAMAATSVWIKIGNWLVNLRINPLFTLIFREERQRGVDLFRPEERSQPARPSSWAAEKSSYSLNVYQEQMKGRVFDWDVPEQASSQQEMRDEPQDPKFSLRNPKRFLEGLLDQYLSSTAATHHNTQGSDTELPLLLSAALPLKQDGETMSLEELPMPDAPLEGEDNPSQASQTPQEKVCLSCFRVLHQLAASTTCAEAMAATSVGTTQVLHAFATEGAQRSAGIAGLIENYSSSRHTYSLTAPPPPPNSAKPPAAITSDVNGS